MDSHGALFYFQSHYTRIDPPAKTEKDYNKKMQVSVVAAFNRAQEETGGKTMAASTFRKHLEKNFPRVSICPHKEDFCDTCKALDIDMKRTTFIIRKIKESGNTSEDQLRLREEELKSLRKQHQDHLLDAKLARTFHNNMVARCKEQWKTLAKQAGGTHSDRHTFTLVLSADYQQAKLVPHWGKTPQPASTYYLSKESVDVFGIVDHRDDSGHVRLFSETIGPKNTDHTVSLLHSYIEDVKAKHPWLQRVLIFLDNATSTNKNRFLFGWAMEVVKSGLLQSIHICFLVAGHTKFAPDRLFALCAKSYNAADVFNIGELGDIYAKHCSVSICTEAHVHPWRTFLDDNYTDLPGVRKLHKFLIVRGEGNAVIFRVGERCYDQHTVTSPMRKTGDSNALTTQQQHYSSHQLTQEKLDQIEQMCHRFVAQSRWPAYISPRSTANLPSLKEKSKKKGALKKKSKK